MSTVTEARTEQVVLTPPSRWRGLLRRHLAMPAVLTVVLLGTYLWVRSADLDDIERRSLNADYLLRTAGEHVTLTALTTVLVVAIAGGGGILLTRRSMRWLAPFATGLANIGQATPAIGLLVLLSIFLGIGFSTALIGLVAYSVLPVLQNTIVGINQVDRHLIEAGRGIGMSPFTVLVRIELPLAVPVILAGVRTALVLAVGVATLATFIDAGGLGAMIVTGIKLQRETVLVTGAVLTATLALTLDWLGGVVSDLLRPRGLD
ncbi:ABC transporter permease [Salinispora arenicola]|uniref:Binding-protein-dependent transport systems inner membrane component n=1 Tax=Salinispora arenicola (strain CNS-205) TaxID=391037 RepID=A8LVP5_SALAI|nr:ABC transporter permease [Salinispora arenicola]MCN0178121.1 ABC transporter permease [Salinispora arenicola]NIL57524.1 ABC transporter permease [Salinispora arenicola]NIL61460.1 ABC transporter permease [Salinispora arenicola]